MYVSMGFCNGTGECLVCILALGWEQETGLTVHAHVPAGKLGSTATLHLDSASTTKAHACCTSKVVVALLVGHVQSASVASTILICLCLLPLWPVPPHQQMSLLHTVQGPFQTTVSLLGLGGDHNPFKRGVCFFIALLDSLVLVFLFFSSQVFCGFISLVYILRVGSPMWGTNLFLLWEMHLCGEIPSCVLPCHEWVFFGRLSLLLLFWYDPFILCCENQFIQFLDLSAQGNDLRQVQIGCVDGRRTFPTTTLDHPLQELAF